MFLLFITAIVVGVIHFDLYDKFFEFLEWLKENPLEGSFIFVGVIAGLTPFLIPGSILWVGAGFAFRPLPLAIVVACAGSYIGLTLSFLIGRYLFRDTIEDEIRARPEWGAVDRVIERKGWKFILILRCAMFPYNVGNYIFSLTSVKFWDYVGASALGLLPAISIFCYFGSLARDIHSLSTGKAEFSPRTTILIACISGVVIISIVAYITIKARQAMKDELREAREESDAETADNL